MPCLFVVAFRHSFTELFRPELYSVYIYIYILQEFLKGVREHWQSYVLDLVQYDDDDTFKHSLSDRFALKHAN
jgi:hypothetical protein